MKKFIKKIKEYLNKPVDAKFKTRGIFIVLCSILAYSLVVSIFVHWALILIPIALTVLLVYLAKLPIKQEKCFKANNKRGDFYKKKKR